jgi:hypothetical protein
MFMDDNYNGRVNIMEGEDNAEIKFRMYERIAVKNKATEYRDALLGVLEENVLAQVYFSAGNEQILQNGIRAGVYNMSKDRYVVSQQNSDQLKIVMRSIYLQFARHSNTDVTGQVEVLNKMVLDYCVPYVYSEAVSYVKYLRDQSSLVMPLDHALQSDRQYKQLQEKSWL